MGEGLDLPQADASTRATSSTWAASLWPLPAPPAPSWPMFPSLSAFWALSPPYSAGKFTLSLLPQDLAHAAVSDCFTILSSLKQVSRYLLIQIVPPWGNILQYLQIKSFYPVLLKGPSDHSYEFPSMSHCYVSSPPRNLAIFAIIIAHNCRVPLLCPALF